MPRPLDRRKFFGSAAVLSLSAAGYARVAGSNERVRVGFLGCGGRAQAHIDVVNRLAAAGHPVAPAAVCDVWDGLEDEYEVAFGGRRTRRRYAQGLYPSARKCGLDPTDRSRVTKDYRRVLDRADVDVVCIATPDHWHGRMTVDALEAGKDVFLEPPLTRTPEEAVAVLDAWQRSGRVVAVGIPSLADPVWSRAGEWIRSGGIGHVAHGQAGVFRNDVRGQWRYYRLVPEMTPRTIDWDLFLGHRFELAGRRIGPTPAEQPFDRAAFAQWRCLWAFSAGPFSDLLTAPAARLSLAAGLLFPARVTAGGGLYLESDGREVPDVVSIVADYDEGCQLHLTAATITGYPTEEVIRGRLGAVRFVAGGFEVYRDDPTRGPVFPPRTEGRLTPAERVTVESPDHETQALWENFLACVRTGRPGPYCPPDLGAAAVVLTALAARSYREGRAWGWDRQRRAAVPIGPGWAARWEQRSRARPAPTRGDTTGAATPGPLDPPEYQKLAGPWLDGRDPADAGA